MEKSKTKKADSSNIVLEVRNINKKFRDGEDLKNVLTGIRISISPKDFVGIIGPSGSGKSTLLNAITGIEDPDDGLIYFNGKNFTELTAGEKSKLRLKEMGFVYRNNNLIEFLTIKENLELPLQLSGVGSLDIKLKVDKTLKDFNLENIQNKLPHQINRLDEKKVAFAKATIFVPRIVYMDEPTGDLSTSDKEEFLKMVLDFKNKNKIALVIFSHDSQIAMKVSKVFRIENGKII